MHFPAYIIFLHVFFVSPSLSLSLSSLSPSLSLSLPPSLPPFLSICVSLWLQDTCHLMPFTKQHNAYAWVVTSILFLTNLTFHTLSLHSSYKIHQPFTDYFLRLPYSELLEKRLFSLSGQPSSSWRIPAAHGSKRGPAPGKRYKSEVRCRWTPFWRIQNAGNTKRGPAARK